MTCLRRERVNKIHPGFLFTFLAYFSTVESHRKVNKSAEQSWWAMVDFGLFSGLGRVYKIIHFSRVFFTSGYTIWCFLMKSQRLKRTSLKFCVWSFHPMNQVWMSTQGILSWYAAGVYVVIVVWVFTMPFLSLGRTQTTGIRWQRSTHSYLWYREQLCPCSNIGWSLSINHVSQI